MKERLERTLVSVARHYAPHLIPTGWERAGDYTRPLPELARALAAHNVLVMLGDIPVPYTADASVHIKLWVDTYTRLYQVLARSLFPSLMECQAYYADQEWPPIVVLHGKATPLISAFGGYIVPFVVARQGTAAVSSVELRGLMDLLLEELEATDLPRDDYQRLRNEASGLVEDLLALHVRQMPLTPPVRAVFGVTPAAPPSPPAPTPPATLPENLPDGEPPPTLPIVPPTGQNKRRPPLPDLPENKRE